MADLTNTPEPALADATLPGGAPRWNNDGTRDYFRAICAGRHPSTQHIVRQFAWSHLPVSLQDASAPFGALVETLLGRITTDGPELTVALRKLREAKDCAVVAMVDQLGA